MVASMLIPVILAALLVISRELVLTQSKNISILNNMYYMTHVNITRVNAEYTPSMFTIEYQISNVIPNANQYFDLFYYMDKADRQCYESVIGNESYLRACSFIQNNYTVLRSTSFSATPIVKR